MDLHFCSRCGISIPQVEIDAGSAGGADGKYFCAEHRAEAAVAVGAGARSGGFAPASAAPREGGEPELLFCANCRVSIPQDDAKSGRAHREFGSLLCAGCSKADPGERAARREAVEAEMAADVDAQDPVVARRCTVCSAVVPYGQIVTGKAKVDGNRVVCERCREVAAARTESDGARSFPTSALVVVIILIAATAIGYFAAKAYIEHQRTTAAAVAKDGAELSTLRGDMDRRFVDLDSRLAGLSRRDETDPNAAADRQRLDAEIATVRQSIADLRDQMSKADTELQQRISKLEGQIQSQSEFVRGLAARPTEPSQAPPSGPTVPPAPVVETAPRTPPKDAQAPAPPVVNPAVVKFCKDLLESSDDGIRFNAARELGDLNDASATPSLVEALANDKHYFVRRACAIALSKLKAWLAVPALIKTLEDHEPYVALAANNALQKITGNDFGVTQDTPAGQRKTKAQAAEKWWDKNRDHPPEGVSLHPIN